MDFTFVSVGNLRSEDEGLSHLLLIQFVHDSSPVALNKMVGLGQQSDGTGVLTPLLSLFSKLPGVGDGVSGCSEHWKIC